VLLAAPPADAGGTLRVHLLEAAGVAAGVVLLWWGAMEAFGLNAFFAKRPGDVWAYMVTAPGAAEHRAVLGAALIQTLSTAVPGYLAGLAAGLGLAVICVLAPVLAATILPVAVALRAVPIVTTAPLIVLALGRGAVGTIAIVAVMIFFPTLIACLQGLRLLPGQVMDMFDSYAAGRVRTLVLARLPAMLPAFFAAARMSVPAAVLAATVAEWLATGTGTGNLMALTASTSNYNMLWSCVAALTLVSVAGHGLVALAERAVLARYAPEQLRR
jgi:ABC-type nitrate/sulfonate/bicarbonate transport system permease component